MTCGERYILFTRKSWLHLPSRSLNMKDPGADWHRPGG